MNRTTSKMILFISWNVFIIATCANLYSEKYYAVKQTERAKSSEERTKQALLDERVSRYLECSGPICDERWPDAAAVVKKAQAKVEADNVAKAAKNKE